MSIGGTASFPLETGIAAPRGAVRVLALALVWLTFATSSIVFAEPAVYDVLMMGLILALPFVRLADLTPHLLLYLGFWLAVAAGGLLATTQAVDGEVPFKHTMITLYLSVSAVLVAAFVRCNPERHVRVILSGYALAAFIAAASAVLGYFRLVPGAFNLFTEFGRASGSFKDPNVFGPFLVPVLLYGLHLLAAGGARRSPGTVMLIPLLLFGILITFSRGAWLNATVALAVYGYLSFAIAPSHRRRFKLVVVSLLGAGLAVGVFAAALQVSEIADLFQERATLTQSYDEGPEGRFGGQRKAIGMIIERPLGVGALEFGTLHHNQDAHNVYISMFLNAGWLGGLVYLALVAATLLSGFRHVLRDTPTRGLGIVFFAAFAGLAVEGLIIDTDHWRHFFVLMGLIWGLAEARTPTPDTG